VATENSTPACIAVDSPFEILGNPELATPFGRYSYLRVTALLRAEGWRVDHKRIERLWKREGLKMAQKQPKRRRLWFNDGSSLWSIAATTGPRSDEVGSPDTLLIATRL
jgi:transposase InsO family protein